MTPCDVLLNFLGTGEHESELLLILEEDMPRERTSSTGPTEPLKKLPLIVFYCLDILYCGGCCACIAMYIVSWATRLQGLPPYLLSHWFML